MVVAIWILSIALALAITALVFVLGVLGAASEIVGGVILGRRY